MIAARLHALGGGRHRRPEPTGACDLDLDKLLASGALEIYRRPTWWGRLMTWLHGGAS